MGQSLPPAASDNSGSAVFPGRHGIAKASDGRRRYSLTDPACGPVSAISGSSGAVSGAGGTISGRPASPGGGLVSGGISDRTPVGMPSTAAERAGWKKRAEFLEFSHTAAPVVGFQVLKNDVVTVRRARFPAELAARLDGASRGKIEYLSKASRKKLALLASNSPIVFRSFLTVSYPGEFPCDGELVKVHLHSLLKALRRRCPVYDYLWFLEFQQRGAPHFHIFLSHDLPQPHDTMRRRSGSTVRDCLVHWPSQDWLSDSWYRIVGSGDERHLRAGSAWEVLTSPDGAAKYVAKECSKPYQKWVPKAYQSVGRFWGASRSCTPAEGKFVPASMADIRRIFPSGIDPNGFPFPILYSQSGTYRDIEGTPADPVKVRSFRSRSTGRTQKELLFDGAVVGDTFRAMDSGIHGGVRPQSIPTSHANP